MKGEIQFWGQTNNQTNTHTNICPSRAASLQLKSDTVKIKNKMQGPNPITLNVKSNGII